MVDQENEIQNTAELPRSSITEVKQSRQVITASKTITSPKKTGGLKDAANKDYTRVEKLVDSKALHRTFITSQAKSDIAVYKGYEKLDAQKKKATKEDAVVEKKDDDKTEDVSIDQEKLKQELKQLHQDIQTKTALVLSKKTQKKKLFQDIKDIKTEIEEMKALTAREKGAVDELKEQVEELESTDKELDEMIASLDQMGTGYEAKRQEKQQAIDDLLNTLSELKYEISELKGVQ